MFAENTHYQKVKKKLSDFVGRAYMALFEVQLRNHDKFRTFQCLQTIQKISAKVDCRIKKYEVCYTNGMTEDYYHVNDCNFCFMHLKFEIEKHINACLS